MSSRRRENLLSVGSVVIISGVGSVGVGVVVANVLSVVLVVLGLFYLGLSLLSLRRRLPRRLRRRSRSSQVPASRHTVLHLANPRSLRWVRGLLPADEGTVWLAEVTSLLTETTDEGERRRYVRSYRRKVPQLIWTSWTEHLRASRQRELL